VKRHCIRCEAEVDRLERSCPHCGLQLRKECPLCHYWGEIDRAYCLSCKHSFPLPAPPKATIKVWHGESEASADDADTSRHPVPRHTEQTRK
jgi:hypothetical protein